MKQKHRIAEMEERERVLKVCNAGFHAQLYCSPWASCDAKTYLCLMPLLRFHSLKLVRLTEGSQMNLASLHNCNNFTTANELMGPLTHWTDLADSGILTLLGSLLQAVITKMGRKQTNLYAHFFCWVLKKFYAHTLLAIFVNIR